MTSNHPSFNIRLYEPADRDAIAVITHGAWSGVTVTQLREERFGPIGDVPWRERKANQVLARLDADPEHWLVAELGSVVGYTYFGWSEDGHVGFIGNNAVSPDMRGRGIGRALIRHALEILVCSGVQLLEVETLTHDKPARHVYEALGFQQLMTSVRYAMAPAELKSSVT